MENENFKGLKEFNNLFKGAEAQIRALSSEIGQVDHELKKIQERRGHLSDELQGKKELLSDLRSFSRQMNVVSDNPEMANYLCIGFMVANGLSADQPRPEPEPVQETEMVSSKKALKAKKEEPSDYSMWASEIREACKGFRKNTVIHRAYGRARKNYGFCFEQERKDFFYEVGRQPKSTMELFHWVERKKPVNDKLLLVCVKSVVEEMEKEAV